MLQPARAARVLALLLLCLRLNASPWPEVESDIPLHPELRVGQLSNGLRYLVLPNREPRDRVSIRLLVAAGSLHERDDEQGLAHFIEHMAFRGTRNFPNGTMILEMQRLGMQFGPDHTAFTSSDHTIYHLELPGTDAEMLRKGFGFIREYAESITFEPDHIERERGVILSERDTRDTPPARMGIANLNFLWPGSRAARRLPIGLPEQIRTFTREQFVAFYDAWYRPERLAVVVVGDIDADETIRELTGKLASLQAHAPAREDLSQAIPLSACNPDIQIYRDQGLSGVSCQLQHPFPDPRAPDTAERRATDMHRNLAFAMFERRLNKLLNTSGTDFVSAHANVTTPIFGWSLASFGISGNTENWKEAIADLEQEHRRAILFGFSPEELEVTRLAFSTGIAEAVRTEPSWPSWWIANQLAGSVVQGTVFTSASIMQDHMLAALETASPSLCLAAFRNAWGRRTLHVFIGANDALVATPHDVADVLNASREIQVVDTKASVATEFAYTDFGLPGLIERSWRLEDLDVQQARFVNGVHLNHKTTDFEADTVQVSVRVGTGQLSQPKNQPGLDLLAEQLLPRGGLGRHHSEELADLFAAHRLAVNFDVESDAFTFRAQCARRDLLLSLQVITAFLTDSAFRPEAMRTVNAAFGSMYTSIASSPGGPISAVLLRLLSGDDLRFGVPTPEELGARTPEDVAAWLRREFEQGAIEISIVGDADWVEASDAVSRTLGTLPTRTQPFAAAESKLTIPRPSERHYSLTSSPQLRQVALVRVCPVRDDVSIQVERRCVLLAQLLSERIRVRLRDELGSAYSSSVNFVRFPGFPKFNYFIAYAEVSMEQALRASELITLELDALRKGRFTDDEFERVKVPFLRARVDDLRTNAYWGYTVLRDAQQRPDRLAAARDRATDTAAITRQELKKLAARYFKPKEIYTLTAYPSQTSFQNPFATGTGVDSQ